MDVFEIVNAIAEKRSNEIDLKYNLQLERSMLIRIGFIHGMIEALYLCSKNKNSV